MKRWASALIAALCLLASWPPMALAQVSESDRAAARELGREGIELYKAGDYATALDRLTRAHTIVDLSTTGLWRARCLVALGQLVEASEQYLAVTRMTLSADAPGIHVAALEEASRERDALLPQVPSVRLRSAGPFPADAVITIDDQPVPAALIGAKRPVDPGTHVVRVTRGDRSETSSFSIEPGASIELALTIPSTPATDVMQSTRPTAPPDDEDSGAVVIAGWATVALGGAVFIGGVVTGLLALDTQSDLDGGCVNSQCPPDLHDEVDEFETLRTLSLVGIIAGGAIAIGGVTMLAVSAPGQAEVSLRVTPLGLALGGRF
jgi:hypothetical protein